MKTKNILIEAFAVFAISFLFLECSKSSSSNNNDNSNGGNNSSNTIYMKNSVFSNTNLTVFIGGTVVWINDDVMVHTATADDGSFNSGDIQAGGKFSRTFNATGVYPYHCAYHSGMKGQINVVIGIK